MVQCEACSKWYHSICIGICVHHFADHTRFCCCQTQAQNEYVFIQDTRTIWPDAGISDAVIDFLFGKDIAHKPSL